MADMPSNRPKLYRKKHIVTIIEIMKDAKYKYKLAVRDAANEFEGRLDDELLK